MANDKEQEVRLHFLGEAEEYFNDLESGLLGLGSDGVSRQQMDSLLRSAHSIKGGGSDDGLSNPLYHCPSLRRFL